MFGKKTNDFSNYEVERWLKLALKTYLISNVSHLNEWLLCQVLEYSLFLTANGSARWCEKWERAVEDRGPHTHVRETDVNSWDRDTCVHFMCCLLDDVWCCLKRFWIGICYDGAIMQKCPGLCMMSMVKVKRNTLTQFGNSYLSHTMFYVCLIYIHILYYRV